MLVHRCSVNQRLPVLETHHIPIEHTGWTMLILVRVISIEESVAEPLLFGLPAFNLKLRTRLRFLPSAPFNARCDGSGLIFHGSPPLLDRTSADCVAHLPPRPLEIGGKATCHTSASLLVKAQRGCQGGQGIGHFLLFFLAKCQLSYMFQSVAVVRWVIQETTIGC